MLWVAMRMVCRFWSFFLCVSAGAGRAFICACVAFSLRLVVRRLAVWRLLLFAFFLREELSCVICSGLREAGLRSGGFLCLMRGLTRVVMLGLIVGLIRPVVRKPWSVCCCDWGFAGMLARTREQGSVLSTPCSAIAIVSREPFFVAF